MSHVIVGIVVVLVIGGAFFLYRKSQAKADVVPGPSVGPEPTDSGSNNPLGPDSPR